MQSSYFMIVLCFRQCVTPDAGWPPRCDFSAVYLPKRRRILVFAGDGQDGKVSFAVELSWQTSDSALKT